MFLFLSKLIPLFFYPIGITCLLLFAALIFLWLNSKWTPVAIGLALSVLFLSGNTWTSNWLAQSLEPEFDEA